MALSLENFMIAYRSKKNLLEDFYNIFEQFLVVYPGQSGCEDSRQCSKAYPGALCNEQKICECPDNLVAEFSDCVPGENFYFFFNSLTISVCDK